MEIKVRKMVYANERLSIFGMVKAIIEPEFADTLKTVVREKLGKYMEYEGQTTTGKWIYSITVFAKTIDEYQEEYGDFETAFERAKQEVQEFTEKLKEELKKAVELGSKKWEEEEVIII